MERQGCRRTSCGALVRDMRSHRHLLPRHEGCRVQWSFCCGEHESTWLTCNLLIVTKTFLPVILALYHSIRHPSQRQYPAWSADSRPKTLLERVVSFTYGDSTRYIVPSILLSISSFLVLIKTSALRSTYICPVSNSTAALIPTLQFVGFALDTIIVQLLYRLIDDGISPVNEWTIQLQDGTSNNLLIGLTFTVRIILAFEQQRLTFHRPHH